MTLAVERDPNAPLHPYNWRPALPGLVVPVADTGGLQVQSEVDPRNQMPPVFNQGQLGSCTANASAGCFQYDSIVHGKDCGLLSRRWIYHFEKVIEHTIGQGDTGAMGHDAFTVAKHGIPNESRYPYSEDIRMVETKPPDVEPRAYRLERQVRGPAQNETTFKQVLSNRQTIAFGFTVYESFEMQWREPGIMPVPTAFENILGGHEVLVVGYLPSHPGYFLVRNSWGEGWGLGGYFLMPYEVLLNPEMASDFRTVVF